MGSWTSLQVASLAVDALTPVAVAGLGVVFARTSRRIEQVQWANQTLVTRRMEIFAELAPGLNQLLCFATFVGGWKEIQPRQAIAVKRQLDEIMYANKVLFSDDLFAAYHAFMSTLFAMYATTDADAHLRAPVKSQWGDRRNMPWWDEASMTSLFSSANPASIEDIQAAYDALAERFRADLYVTSQNRPLLTNKTGGLPGWLGRVRGRPKRASRLLSTKRSIAAIRPPSTVSTTRPQAWSRAAAGSRR